ncbi:mitochondrial small ribosomal subunit Rsm22-domain-containing protein [Pyronema domesticum]|nr:mitochondrial small ribosomal subunit Rsm22-domain-containing protein [Pyronema domesticum]
MLAARGALRRSFSLALHQPLFSARATPTLSTPPAALHRFTTSAVSYKKKKYPPQTQGPTPDPLEDFPEEDEEGDVTIESLVRDVRDLWGNNLPIGLLNKEEYAVYERYYGAPIRMLSEEDIEEMRKEVEDQLMGEPDEEVGTVTLEDAEGVEIEAVEEGEEFVEQQEGFEVEEEEFDGEEEEGEREFIGETTPGNFQARNEKEAAMYRKIASDLEKVLSVSSNAEELAPPELPEEEEEEWFSRTHPLTQLGRFATHPSTIQLPESVKVSTERILSEVANKHLDEAAMDILGGAQLTKSPIMAGKVKNYNSIPLDTTASMSDMEANVHIAAILPGYYAQTLSALSELRKRLGSDWVLGHKDTNEGGIKNVLDIGTGGAGIFALRDIIRAETELRNEERAVNQDEPPVEIPETEEHGPINDLRSVVVVGSNSLRFRMSKMLEHTTFVPRLPDARGEKKKPRHHRPNDLQDEADAEAEFKATFGAEVEAGEGPVDKQPRKLYDLIISTNTLLPLREDYQVKNTVDNLWSLLNPNGGVLLLIEKGTPRGFEAIASARDYVLQETIQAPGELTHNVQKEKEIGSIVAPCTNHAPCPMFVTGPATSSRKDYCTFMQRYERPTYMQRIIKATTKNHEDLVYSYVSFRRGIDVTKEETPIDPKIEEFDTTKNPAKSPYSMQQLRQHAYNYPRLVFNPMKRTGHVIMDMCTPQGAIERWTVPKSFGKVAWHDARKSRWGDLWALDAKTKIPRNLKLGNAPTGQMKEKYGGPKYGETESHLRGAAIHRDKPGGKKRNPGKRERERRQIRRAVQLDRMNERDLGRRKPEDGLI